MVVLLIANILWWFGFAYGLGSRPVEQYSYVLGLPAWFFYSCVLGYVVFSLASYLAVRFFFKDIPLDSRNQERRRTEIMQPQAVLVVLIIVYLSVLVGVGVFQS